MKKLVLAASVATLLSVNAQADTLLGVYLGGQSWDSQASGVFGELDNLADFNLQDKRQGSYFIAVEHPVPVLPNIKVASTTLDTSGNTTLTFDFSFGGQNFTDTQAVDAVFNVSYVDYTLYYEIFDNDLLTLDLGLTARDIDGDVQVELVSDPSLYNGQEDFSAIIPMLYVSAIVGLPFTGLNIFAEGNAISYDDHSIYDYQAGISYEVLDNIAVDLNVTLGYRAVQLNIEDIDDFYADLDFKGVFVGAIVHF